jgi:hypothetical protein
MTYLKVSKASPGKIFGKYPDAHPFYLNCMAKNIYHSYGMAMTSK